MLRFVALTLVACTLWGALASGAMAQSAQDEHDIARIEAYLNDIRTMRGRFLQVAADGAMANGVFYLRRPRRFRFEYAPPSPVLLVGDGLWLIFHDRELGQVSRVPLTSSPLSLLIDNEVSLTDHAAHASIVREPGVIRITLNDPEEPEQGELTLVLTDPPLALRQWHVTDAQGLTTRISLFETEANVPLEAKLFTFSDPPPGRN